MAYGVLLGQQPGVQSVNKKTPDATGNVTLNATDVNAIENKSESVNTNNLASKSVTEEKIDPEYTKKFAPKITASTVDLVDGSSPLDTGVLYVVYEQ